MKFDRKTVTHDQFLSDEELVTLYGFMNDHARDSRWTERFATVRHALGTGSRVSEMINLVLSEETITGPINFCRPDGYLYLRKWKDTTGKHHQNRERVVKVIPEYLPYYQARWHQLKREGFNVLFPNTLTGEDVITTRILQRRWAETLRAAGLIKWGRNPKQGIHCGRHTYATHELAYRRGMTPHLMQYLLGHKHQEETMSVYNHAIVGIWNLYEETGTEPQWWAVAAAPFTERKLRIAR